MKRIITILTLSLSISIMHGQYFEQNLNAGDLTNINLKQAGATWMDYNNDGLLDLVVMGYDNPAENRTRIYQNMGGGSFTALGSSDFYVTGTGGPTSVAGDYDNDGDLDVYQLNFQDSNGDPAGNIIYENMGAPNFELVATNLVGGTGEENHSSSGTWVDYDQDGDLDLFATGALNTPDIFYRNDGGTFVRVQTLSFLTTRAWAIATDTWFDFDRDGDLDVYFANFSNQDNKLYLSQFAQTGDADNFIEASIPDITNNAGTNIGCNWIDYDNDLDLDLFLNYFNNTDKLYANNGDGTFTEITDQPMTQNSGWTTVNSWADFDNDGDLDLYQNTGGGGNFPGFLYENDGTGQFTTVDGATAGDIVNAVGSPQGGGWGDYDGDGDMDLTIIACCVTFPNGASLPNVVFENKVGQNNSYAKVELEGTTSNKRGIGAEVRIKANINGTSYWQTRRINGGVESFGMQEEQIAHFGLGDATVVDSLIVKWPSGLSEVCTNLPIGDISVIEGACEPFFGIKTEQLSSLIKLFPNPSNGEMFIDNNSGHLINRITVVNTIGKVILEDTTTTDFTYISLDQIASGFYFLLLHLENGTSITKKIIIE